MAPVNVLSDDSDAGEDVDELTINEHYAKAYAYRKERQELERLKEKYGSDAEEGGEEEEDSEELESEDEDGEELTPGVDAAILRTLAKIKRRDPEIYDQEKAIFEEEQKKSGQLVQPKPKNRKDKSKPVTLRQEKLAAELAFTSRSPSPDPDAPKPLTHVQEEKKLREETVAAFHTAVSGDASDEDDLLVPREKTKDELEREEQEYHEFLRREVGEDLRQLIEVDRDVIGVHEDAPSGQGDSESKKKKTKDKGKKKEKGRPEAQEKKEKEDQEFLMNYILNRGWIDRTAKRLPTYTEVTSVRNRKKKSKAKDPEDEGSTTARSSDSSSESEAEGSLNNGIEDEDVFDDVADVFESSFNFRFEEPNAAEIGRYPRNLASTVRREDTTRKEARARRKARKEEELLQKREEVKRLKALKMKELRRKLERIGREGGLQDINTHQALQDLDLEGEWDPESHDRQMAGIYAQDDDGAFSEEEKPTWDDDIDIGDIAPPVASSSKKEKKSKKDKKKGKSTGEEDEDHGMGECGEAYEEEGEWDDEGWDGTEEMRKKKLQEYMDSLLELDFDDVVGGIPTRFKYVNCAPQSFGLTATEILMADDKVLNQYMGIKKYAPYRKGANWDTRRPERLKEFREAMNAKSARGNGEDGEVQVKKRKGKKERLRAKTATAAPGDTGAGPEPEESQVGAKEKKRKREEPSVAVQTEIGAGENSSKKRKRRHKKSLQTASTE
ncbi:KRI1-like family C-terminal-domain-containing protein [Thelephora terrestris]|uniref:KRI1-like family C-terminal-domain-containing protein n=1 Tax=Thelephora terrestris TaxID=56493 RepID=A0A9P6L0W1_9AGAM|nr:KRI1-like family C-terminal-domain-containing protein [Thelephora terrestris]